MQVQMARNSGPGRLAQIQPHIDSIWTINLFQHLLKMLRCIHQFMGHICRERSQ